jgi:uncharacterized protein (TIGR00369 family)
MPIAPLRRTDEQARHLIEQALAVPVHRFLGVELMSLAPGEARCQIIIGENAATPSNTLHGGVLSLVLEIAAYAALMPMIDADKIPTTIDFHNQPMRSVALGDKLEIVAKVLRHGRRTASCEVATFVEGRLMSKGLILKALLDIVD